MLIRFILQNDLVSFEKALAELKKGNILVQSINLTDNNGLTALQYAAMSGRLEMALQLIHAGATTAVSEPENSPLFLALENHEYFLATIFLLITDVTEIRNQLNVQLSATEEKFAADYADLESDVFYFDVEAKDSLVELRSDDPSKAINHTATNQKMAKTQQCLARLDECAKWMLPSHLLLTGTIFRSIPKKYLSFIQKIEPQFWISAEDEKEHATPVREIKLDPSLASHSAESVAQQDSSSLSLTSATTPPPFSGFREYATSTNASDLVEHLLPFCSPSLNTQLSALTWAAIHQNKLLIQLLMKHGEDIHAALFQLAKIGNSSAIDCLRCFYPKEVIAPVAVNADLRCESHSLEDIIYELAKHNSPLPTLKELAALGELNYYQLISKAFAEKNYVVLEKLLNLNNNCYKLVASALKEKNTALVIFLLCQNMDPLKTAFYLKKYHSSLLPSFFNLYNAESILHQLFIKLLHFPLPNTEDIDLFNDLAKEIDSNTVLNIFIKAILNYYPQSSFQHLLEISGNQLESRIGASAHLFSEKSIVMASHHSDKAYTQAEIFKLAQHFKLIRAPKNNNPLPNDAWSEIYKFLDWDSQVALSSVSSDFNLLHQVLTKMPISMLAKNRADLIHLQDWESELTKEFRQLDWQLIKELLCSKEGDRVPIIWHLVIIATSIGLDIPCFIGAANSDFLLFAGVCLLAVALLFTGFLSCQIDYDYRREAMTKISNTIGANSTPQLLQLNQAQLQKYANFPELKNIKMFQSTNRELLDGVQLAISTKKTLVSFLEDKVNQGLAKRRSVQLAQEAKNEIQSPQASLSNVTDNKHSISLHSSPSSPTVFKSKKRHESDQALIQPLLMLTTEPESPRKEMV